MARCGPHKAPILHNLTDIRLHRKFRVAARGNGRGGAIVALVHFRKKIRIVISLPANHHAVHMLEMFGDFDVGHDAAIDQYFELRELAFQLVGHLDRKSVV